MTPRSGRVRWLPPTSLLAAPLLLALAAGCAATREPRGEVERSGFLGSYADLKPGGEGQAKLVYLNPEADLSRYDAILIDSVTLWPGPEGRLAALPAEEQQRLADDLYRALHDALAKDWRIASTPARGTLRLRAALTEAKSSNVPLDVVATAIPQVRLLGTVVGLSADTALTVGEASAEAEITDSVTGERLLAGVDERVGQRSFRGVTDKWSDVEEAFAFWAERLRVRLATLRAEAHGGSRPAP
jgi:hypothetical protein